jgi:Ethanolamine utilization protein EutJ (predicted chaperonin)
VVEYSKTLLLNLGLEVSHSSGSHPRGKGKDSHKALANFFAAAILGVGRLVEAFFRAVFSVLSSIA